MAQLTKCKYELYCGTWLCYYFVTTKINREAALNILFEKAIIERSRALRNDYINVPIIQIFITENKERILYYKFLKYDEITIENGSIYIRGEKGKNALKMQSVERA